MESNIVFLINKSEIGAGTRGAFLGPGAIINAAREKENTLFSQIPIVFIEDQNQLLDKPVKYASAKRIEGLVKVYQELNDNVSKLLTNLKFPIILAADHGSAGGTISGIKSAFPDKKIGVVWIDAHADIHTPYTSPSGNMHGMPLAIALNQDNIACQVNEVDADVIQFWNQLKATGLEGPKIDASDLVYIAVRDTESQEDSIMKELNIKNYSVAEFRQKGVASVIVEIEKKLQHCDLIYVSFDVDSMDPELTSYGTGTPVENGLYPKEANELLNRLAQNPKTKCMEFVEVNPCLDNKKNRMAEITFDLVESVIKTLQQ